MVAVTVSGGAGRYAALLRYDTTRGLAYAQAQAAAAYISETFTNSVLYRPDHPPHTPSPGYLLIRAKNADNVIHATGFNAIVDANRLSTSTVDGGTASGQSQLVLASDGGLTFTARSGMETVIVGGGDNLIRLGQDSDASAVYIAAGNNTIFAGQGAMTVAAGIGDNSVTLGGGADLDYVNGQDTIRLGGGSDTIQVSGQGSALVLGATSASGSGFNLIFSGGKDASTVEAGAGSYSIQGGAGGGLFQGGTGGNNFIAAGGGAATIIGGGAGDTLSAGSGSTSIVAALGNETLIGSNGASVLDLTIHGTFGNSGDGTIDTIDDFSSRTLLDVGNQQAINYALNTYHVDNGSGSFLLEDGTRVVLAGYTGHLSAGNFTQ